MIDKRLSLLMINAIVMHVRFLSAMIVNIKWSHAIF